MRIGHIGQEGVRHHSAKGSIIKGELQRVSRHKCKAVAAFGIFFLFIVGNSYESFVNIKPDKLAAAHAFSQIESQSTGAAAYVQHTHPALYTRPLNKHISRIGIEQRHACGLKKCRILYIFRPFSHKSSYYLLSYRC